MQPSFIKRQIEYYKYKDKFPDLYMRYYRHIKGIQYSYNVTYKRWTYKKPNNAPIGPFASFTEAYEHSTLI